MLDWEPSCHVISVEILLQSCLIHGFNSTVRPPASCSRKGLQRNSVAEFHLDDAYPSEDASRVIVLLLRVHYCYAAMFVSFVNRRAFTLL